MRKPRAVTVRAAFEDYMLACSQHSAKTQRWYNEKLGTFLRYCDTQGLEELQDVRAADVRRFLVYLDGNSPSGRKLSTYTLHGFVQVIKGLWAFAEREGLLESNPIAHLQNVRVDQKVIATFSTAQVAALFAAARKTRHPYRDQAILSMLFDTGIRASELCGLTVEHTHLDNRGSYIQVFGKGRKERQCPVGPQAALAVRRYMSRERPMCSLPVVFIATGTWYCAHYTALDPDAECNSPPPPCPCGGRGVLRAHWPSSAYGWLGV
jgi:site-specific recombinase XerD